MSLPQFPFYYHPLTASSLIQAATGVSQPQNMTIPTATSSAGSTVPGLPSIHYSGAYLGIVQNKITCISSILSLLRSPSVQFIFLSGINS